HSRTRRYQHRVRSVNTLSRASTGCMIAPMAAIDQTQTARPVRGRRSARTSGDERERAILQTAEELLRERSLTDIAVDEPARGAGISRSTFYFYFPSDRKSVV